MVRWMRCNEKLFHLNKMTYLTTEKTLWHIASMRTLKMVSAEMVKQHSGDISRYGASTDIALVQNEIDVFRLNMPNKDTGWSV